MHICTRAIKYLPGNGEYPVLGSATSPLQSPCDESSGSNWLYSTLMTRLYGNHQVRDDDQRSD